jgi:hypothetical protein
VSPDPPAEPDAGSPVDPPVGVGLPDVPPVDPQTGRDALDEVITLAEGAQMCGLAAHTLTLQAERGKLRARKMGHTWITTRHWLDVYLADHARRKR